MLKSAFSLVALLVAFSFSGVSVVNAQEAAPAPTAPSAGDSVVTPPVDGRKKADGEKRKGKKAKKHAKKAKKKAGEEKSQ